MRPKLPKIDSYIRTNGFEYVANQLVALLEETQENDNARGTSGRNMEEKLALKKSVMNLQFAIKHYQQS